MLDRETVTDLKALEDAINDNIDKLIIKRDNSVGTNKADYRYAVRKLQHALGMVSKPLDKYVYKNVDFTLDNPNEAAKV